MTSTPLSVWLATCLIAGSVVAGAPAQKPSPQQKPSLHTMSTADAATLQTALKAYNQQNDAAAEPLLYDIASRYPADFTSNEALGSLYAAAGDPLRALPYLQHACTAAPRQPIAHANLGAAYLKLNRTSDAVHELQAAAKLDPRNPETQSNLGHALMAASQPAEAARAFGSAADLQPQNVDLLYNWALALANSNAPLQADAVLQKIPPPSMTDEAHALAGDVDERLSHFKEAVVHYQAAAQINPSDTNLYALTLELLRHWTWAQALDVANFGVTRYPSQTRFKVAAGIALYGDNKFPQAAAAFSTLLQQDPANQSYADLLGRSCGAVAEGVDTNCSGLESFALAHPQNARISVYAAASILHRPATPDSLTRADRLLAQAIAADPRLPDAYYQLGVLAQQRSDWAASQTALEKAVQLRPSFAEAHYRLSRAYAHLNRRDDAQHEIALQQQYSQQEKDQLNAHMQEVVLFLLKPSS